jgi:hypothetical protein
MSPGIYYQEKLFNCSKGNGITIKVCKINETAGNKYKL